MRIKEVVQQTGLTEKTIRYYESCCLVTPHMEERNGRLWRDYTEEHVRQLAAVATLRRASFQVDEISMLMDAPEKIPEILQAVQQRVEETWSSAGLLREQLRQENLRKAADVYDLASQLDKAASALSLPAEDLAEAFPDPPKEERPMKNKHTAIKARSLSRTILTKQAFTMAGLWLLMMLALTLALAGDLGHQGTAYYTPALEKLAAEYGAGSIPWDAGNDQAALTLPPELPFVPDAAFPLQLEREMRSWSAGMILDEKTAIVWNEGFDLGTIPAGASGLAAVNDKLALSPEEPYRHAGVPSELTYKLFYLTFRTAPGRRGSFPLLAGSYSARPDLTFRAGVTVRAHDYTLEGVRDPALFSPAMDPSAMLTDPLLLDGIDAGTLVFESRGLFYSSVLRGCWLRNEEGLAEGFFLGAYGWSPLLTALRALIPVYVLFFLLCQLLGILLWLSFRKTLLRPLRALDAALRADPMAVTEAEYDFRTPYEELRGPLAGHLLRRQMQQAEIVRLLARQRTGDAPLTALLPMLRRCEEKMLPILRDRRLRLTHETAADGLIPVVPAVLEDIGLALFREILPYTEQDGTLTLRTREQAGFLLTEAEVPCKQLKDEAFQLLWDGIYRGPRDMDAPGAKLRKAIFTLPGAFAALRKTKRSLILTLGLPKAGESSEPMPDWPEGKLGAEEQPRRSGRQRLVGILVFVLILLILAIWIVLTLFSRRVLYSRWQ
ncbi:MAG: MerR family transcriptional regulator [Oscillospiraceae bacterium]|nr:MerR family transcriptional regulator [Oscillospiraceae bacterium]